MIEFKNFSEYERGILHSQLVDAYSFNKKWQEQFESDWQEYDDFFYDNLNFTDKCGFITVLDGKPIGHISWDPRNLPDYVILGHNCINSEHKGKGFGKLQLQEAIKRIKEYKQIKKVIVTTNELLIPAQKNYESVGFILKNRKENKESPFSGDYIDYEMIINNEKHIQ